MSILTELKKLTKKKNATVVSQALPDSLDGGGSGSGGGVLIVNIRDESAEHPDYDTYLVCDKTAKKMIDGMQTGVVYGKSPQILDYEIELGAFFRYYFNEGTYHFVLNDGSVISNKVGIVFSANNENDYPRLAISK